MALAQALRTAGPAIFASGCTVIFALLTLTLAEVNATSGLGPIGAVGIAMAMLSMLTLLPALLAITGRRAFWRPPIFGWGNEQHPSRRRRGRRRDPRRLAAGRRARGEEPRRVWVTTALLLAICTAGVLNLEEGDAEQRLPRRQRRGGRGPGAAGQVVPERRQRAAEIIVPDASRVDAVRSAVAGTEGVAEVRPGVRGEQGVVLNATLTEDPYGADAFDLIGPIRAAAKEAGGEGVLVGGQTAIALDSADAARRDTRIIVPLALLIVFLILVLLLRAVVAPLLLIGTVILSFGAALGASAVIFDVVFGYEKSDPSLPLYTFVFLVALGIDYNIFLMARVREETLSHGARAGMLRGLAVTGAVITSAGIVLAGTFSAARGAAARVPLPDRVRDRVRVLLDTFIVARCSFRRSCRRRAAHVVAVAARARVRRR